jgi:hypothetical protein
LLSTANRFQMRFDNAASLPASDKDSRRQFPVRVRYCYSVAGMLR